MLHVPKLLQSEAYKLMWSHIWGSTSVWWSNIFKSIDKNDMPFPVKPSSNHRFINPRWPTNPCRCAWIFGRISQKEFAVQRKKREKPETDRIPCRRCILINQPTPVCVDFWPKTHTHQCGFERYGRISRKRIPISAIFHVAVCRRVADRRGVEVVAGWPAKVLSEVFRCCWVKVDRHFLGYSFCKTLL